MKPLVMGIINATPDSFSDGGTYTDVEVAIELAAKMVGEGADLLDIGGESTRPGASPVSAEEEMGRVLPIVRALRERWEIPISIDTSKPEVASAAVEAGAAVINDITGFTSDKMSDVLVRNPSCRGVIMHMQGEPRTMQENPSYPRGVVNEVLDFLSERVGHLCGLGVSPERLWVDPGIGFGKTLEQNLTLLRELSRFRVLGGGILVGTSRKSFLAKILGDPKLSFPEREPGTLATNLWALQNGASVFRVHEVGPMVSAIKTWRSLSEQ